MTFKEWLYSDASQAVNPNVNGAWKAPHIITLVLCIAAIVAIALIFRKKDERTRYAVIRILISAILFFELTRRAINFSSGENSNFSDFLYDLLPRPWCAISCWLLIVAMFANKTFLYNAASISAFLNTLIFFAYPEAGFTRQVPMFEQLYSICTHALLLVSALSLITLKFTNFKFKNPTFKQGAMKELIVFAIIVAYSFIEIYLLDICSDPMYFMPDNDVAKVLGGMSYGLYLPLYILFLSVYFSLFYFIQARNDKRKASQEKQVNLVSRLNNNVAKKRK